MLAPMLRVIKALWTTSLLTGMQYRGDFLLSVMMSFIWAAWSVIPLFLVFRHTDSIVGWSYPQTTLVMAFFLGLRGLVEGLVEPNLRQLVSQIRDGTLDFVLLKPADAQLLVSVQKVAPGRAMDVLCALGLGVWSLATMGHLPSLGAALSATLCLLSGVAILYSLWLMAASTAFWWVKVDSLGHLLDSLLDAGRWPIMVYRGWVRLVFTFVLPVALMTSYPALALMDALSLSSVAVAVALGAGFSVFSRWLWRYALRHYTSASS